MVYIGIMVTQLPVKNLSGGKCAAEDAEEQIIHLCIWRALQKCTVWK